MGTRIYVGRLSYQVRERDLERFFKGHGKLWEVLLKNAFGFVVGILYAYFDHDPFTHFQTMSSSRIYVGRLSYQVREKDLERFFRGHGKLREVLLKNGFGFVVGTSNYWTWLDFLTKQQNPYAC